MKRVKLKKKIKFKKINIFIIIIFLLIIINTLLFNIINTKLKYILNNYAIIEAKKFSNLLITSAINETEIDTNNLYTLENNQVNFNSNVINKYLSKLLLNIHKKLLNFEKGIIYEDNINNQYDNKKLKKGIIYEVPLSSILNYPLLSNIGYKIPIKINFIGDINAQIKTDVTNYGINNALIKIYVHIEITEEVLIPFNSDKIKIENDALLSVKIIQGEVPDYYSGKNDTQFTIPLQ